MVGNQTGLAGGGAGAGGVGPGFGIVSTNMYRLPVPMSRHCQSPMTNGTGELLVAGGRIAGAVSNRAFVFDPATASWIEQGGMATAR